MKSARVISFGRDSAIPIALIAIATLAAYWNSLSVPFVFDDLTSIEQNATIRRLWPPSALREVLATPRGTGVTTDGRPLLNFSFALNHAIGGFDVRGYHLLNIVIHIAAALTLFGLVRRALRLPTLARAFPLAQTDPSPAATNGFACASALLWALHPLQTGAVTYLAQRAESLAGLCVLLALYAFVRSIELPHSRTWPAIAVLACFAGVSTKEIAAVAPLLVLLFDRCFVTGSFREAWQQRWKLYLCLAATWLLLGWLIISSGGRAGTAGLTTGVSSWNYLLTQCDAIVRYLRLTLWPDPLIFDYGTSLVTGVAAVWWQALLVLMLFAATVALLIRGAWLGFLGAWFFLTLAPSSSIIPVATQTIAEHRMYLPLAALAATAAAALFRWSPRYAAFACLLLAALAGSLTARRNVDYRTAAGLWADAAAKLPTNSRAHTNLGAALVREGRAGEAMAAFENALQMNPENGEAHTNLGNLLLANGRINEALGHLQEAVRLDPASAPARANLAHALRRAGQIAEALTHYEAALQRDPTLAEARAGFGLALLQSGRTEEAIAQFEEALRRKPDFAEAHYNLASALLQLNRRADARQHLESTLRLQPAHAGAHNNLGNLLLLEDRPAEAQAHFEAALQLEPNSAETHTNLGLALMLQRSFTEAAVEFETALRLNPDYAPARENLARLRSLPR